MPKNDSVARLNPGLYADSIGLVESATLVDFEARDAVESSCKFKAKQLILPGALIAVGIVGVYSHDFRKLSNSIKGGMDDLRGEHYFHADDYLQYLPALTYLSLGWLRRVPAKHSFRERLVVGATAYLVMTGLTNAGKFAFNEKRPDSEARNSFPSGHTATVFTGAELMRQEYGLGLGIASYAVATGVAFLRLYNGRHWFNDVLAGAGIGILSARIGYWMLPLYRKWFRWDMKKQPGIVCVMPKFDYTEHNYGLTVAIIL